MPEEEDSSLNTKKIAGWAGLILTAITAAGGVGQAYVKSGENEVLLENNRILTEAIIKVATECQGSR